jgi:hypothetical protein
MSKAEKDWAIQSQPFQFSWQQYHEVRYNTLPNDTMILPDNKIWFKNTIFRNLNYHSAPIDV